VVAGQGTLVQAIKVQILLREEDLVVEDKVDSLYRRQGLEVLVKLVLLV
jgi:hypothetical protein